MYLCKKYVKMTKCQCAKCMWSRNLWWKGYAPWCYMGSSEDQCSLCVLWVNWIDWLKCDIVEGMLDPDLIYIYISERGKIWWIHVCHLVHFKMWPKAICRFSVLYSYMCVSLEGLLAIELIDCNAVYSTDWLIILTDHMIRCHITSIVMLVIDRNLFLCNHTPNQMVQLFIML